MSKADLPKEQLDQLLGDLQRQSAGVLAFQSFADLCRNAPTADEAAKLLYRKDDAEFNLEMQLLVAKRDVMTNHINCILIQLMLIHKGIK